VSSPFLVLPSGAYAALSHRSYWCQTRPRHKPSPTYSFKALYAHGVFAYAGLSKNCTFFIPLPWTPDASTPHCCLCVCLLISNQF
jgi:hypothetical protein